MFWASSCPSSGATSTAVATRPRPTALQSPSSDGKPEAATPVVFIYLFIYLQHAPLQIVILHAVVVAPDDGHEDTRNMLNCI
jgi:hypothetical protein